VLERHPTSSDRRNRKFGTRRSGTTRRRRSNGLGGIAPHLPASRRVRTALRRNRQNSVRLGEAIVSLASKVEDLLALFSAGSAE
jgi:hypothetical protein